MTAANRSILVIDDEESIRRTLEAALTDEGYSVATAPSGSLGLEKLRSLRCDVVLLDIWMEGMDGLEVLQKIKVEWPDLSVIMMSGHGTIETAVKATKYGAFDFAEKPLSLEKILLLIQNALNYQDLSTENQALRKQVKKQKNLVGESGQMKQIQELIQQVAPTSAPILITGENGTGKELVANSLHALSERYSKPFIEVNCAAIPEELIESELFGHEKGAFTGATQMRRGKFDLANGGTLFLDEIGDMSLKTQAKILRILQEQTFERVGGSETISVDVRVVAATNKDLKEEITQGNFREDLFYRLNVIPFVVPPLRERAGDIKILANYFLKEFATTHSKKTREFSPGALQALEAYSWPGNVRELRNLIERTMILTRTEQDGTEITAATILTQIEASGGTVRTTGATYTTSSDATPTNLRDARQEFEKSFIEKTLKANGGNISKTASVLGIERSHLHKKIKTYGIEVQSG